MKHQEVSESFRRCQEASESIMKAQHQKNNKQTDKIQTQVDSQISTVKKHCQLITLVIKGC